MNGEIVAIIAAVAILGGVVFFVSATPRTVNGENAIPTKTAVSFIAEKGQADATIKVSSGGNDWLFDLSDGQLREPPDQAAKREAAEFRITQINQRPIIAPAYNFPFDDFGAFAATGAKRGTVAGIRASPARLDFGIKAAPDILIGTHDIGAGISLYAPGGILGPWSRHCGVGFGHLWATDSGDSANVFYLAFSTHN